jgi:hypothetical protein
MQSLCRRKKKRASHKVLAWLSPSLDAIQDGFRQATRLQYINSHFMLSNRCVLQQQQIDCKITDVLLKKGTKKHADGWDVYSKVWSHIVLHLPHSEDGFGVTFNDVTKDAALYTTTSRFVACLGDFS